MHTDRETRLDIGQSESAMVRQSTANEQSTSTSMVLSEPNIPNVPLTKQIETQLDISLVESHPAMVNQYTANEQSTATSMVLSEPNITSDPLTQQVDANTLS